MAAVGRVDQMALREPALAAAPSNQSDDGDTEMESTTEKVAATMASIYGGKSVRELIEMDRETGRYLKACDPASFEARNLLRQRNEIREELCRRYNPATYSYVRPTK
jgi:hypothetical protein